MSNSPADYIFAAAAAVFADAPGTFLFQSAEQATLTLNSAEVPAIVLYDYTENQTGVDSSTLSAPLTLYFATSVAGSGDDPAAHQAAVDAMRALKRRFLHALDASPYAQVDTIRDTPFAGAYEARLDGVGVQFTLTIPAGNFCPSAPARAFGGFPYLFTASPAFPGGAFVLG